jgi:hypothetical protein
MSIMTADGYTSSTVRSQPDRVVVQFAAPGTTDIVDAMWWEGRPYAQVSHVS